MLTTTSSKRSRHPPRHLVHHQPPRPMGKVLTCFSYLPSVIHLAMRAAFAKGARVSSQRECMWERERERHCCEEEKTDWVRKRDESRDGPAQPSLPVALPWVPASAHQSSNTSKPCHLMLPGSPALCSTSCPPNNKLLTAVGLPGGSRPCCIVCVSARCCLLHAGHTCTGSQGWRRRKTHTHTVFIVQRGQLVHRNT